MTLGGRVLGFGVMALGVVCLASGDYVLGDELPNTLKHRFALAVVAGIVLLACGGLLQWRQTAGWAAAAVTAILAAIVFPLRDIPMIVANATAFGSYSNTAEDAAVAAGALIVFAGNARISAALAARLKRVGQKCFGLCAVLFGGAHFFYMNLTVPLVPDFLPPSQTFWAVATGLCHIAGGIAILAGIRAHLAAVLLTVMYASFTPLVHVPMLAADPFNHFIWSENALNLALAGAAWVVAESLPAVSVSA